MNLPKFTKTQLDAAIKHLEAGHEYLSVKDRWIKGTWARGEIQVCSLGALERVVFKTNRDEYSCACVERLPAAKILTCAVNALTIPAWNDHHHLTHEQLLAGWKKAIEVAKELRKSKRKSNE